MPPLSSTGRPPLHPGSPSSVQLDGSQDYQAGKKRSITLRSQQSVSFSSHTEVHEVPHCTEYTPEDCQQIWYSAKDLDTFTRETFDQARRLTRNTLRRSDVTRGLESKTPHGYEETSVRRMMAVFAVLSEQRRQFDMGMEDDLIVAQLYFDRTEESKMQALDRAALDALEAELFQREKHSERDAEEDSDLFACCFFAPLAWMNLSTHAPALESL